MSTTELAELIDSKFRELREGSIVTGTIQEIRPQVVLVDIGYKSEGAISISEFEDEEIEVGDQIEVLLERLENDEGIVVLSKEKAAHKQNWDKIVGVYRDGGLVKGKVKSVVKGGLMVNVGVEAFLPGSQVDIIPPRDLNEYVGKVYEFKIVKVNDDRKNIVLSRREVIEAERADQRQRFLETVKEGDKVKKGDKLLSFDIDKIKAAGHNTTVSVIVSNSDDFKAVEGLPGDPVNLSCSVIRTVH